MFFKTKVEHHYHDSFLAIAVNGRFLILLGGVQTNTTSPRRVVKAEMFKIFSFFITISIKSMSLMTVSSKTLNITVKCFIRCFNLAQYAGRPYVECRLGKG
jgi:hypothetical protein